MKRNLFVNVLSNFAVRAIEGAAEAVLGEAQSHLEEMTKKVGKAKKNIRREDELIGEIVENNK